LSDKGNSYHALETCEGVKNKNNIKNFAPLFLKVEKVEKIDLKII
jgi:hypothetical protein